jgi:hypothetical protein
MDIRIVNMYRQYADRGFVKPLLCPRDGTHLPLFAKLDDDDEIVLYCLTCDWQADLGSNTYDRLEDAVVRVYLDL